MSTPGAAFFVSFFDRHFYHPCVVLIARDAFDSTHLHNSTPGDNVFNGQIVITGVCFLPCYTARVEH